MSKTLVRGLDLLEAVDFYGPLSAADLSRRLGWDKATVSRAIKACVQLGWLERIDSRICIGPRASLLGKDNGAGQAALSAQPIVHAVSGVTGLLTQAYVLVGTSAMAIASATPTPWPPMPHIRLPLWAAAGGKVIAAQLDAADLSTRLPPEPYPTVSEILDTIAPPDAVATVMGGHPVGATTTSDLALPSVRDRTAFDRQLRRIQSDGRCVELGEIVPLGCVAVPWPVAGAVASLAVLGPIEEIIDRVDAITAVLKAATLVGASRDTIVSAAAEHS